MKVVRAFALSIAGILALARASALPPPRHYGSLAARDDFVLKRNSDSGGGVATEVGECSQVGIDTLKSGGNAADAIIASGLCVGVIAAYHSGIGGGGFMLVRFNDNNGSHGYEMIDFRETMPAAGNETMYVTNSSTPETLSTIGGLAVGVPGELRGWEMLHKRHGKLPWTQLFKPAISLARNGFNVTRDLAANLKGYDFIVKDPLWAEVYAPNGTVLQEGDTCYRKRYANTLEKISWYGPDFFYKGETAINTAATAYARGGIITTKDLANYTAIVREPVNITYRNSRIFSTVAPSSGAVVLSALKVFEGYPGNYSDSDPEINVTTHRLIEATKFAYGQRTTFGDPAFTANVTDLQRYYLSPPVVEAVRSKIVDNQTFPSPYYDPENLQVLVDHGTSHMAVIDSAGMAVSLTTTVNLIWGSTLMTPDGVILNDEMDDFSSPGQTNSFGFAASPSNFIAPGKRPQSSIASSIAEDLDTGEVSIATGSAGGSRIITATLQNLHHHLDQGASALQSVQHPRWHDQLSGTTVFEWKDPSEGLVGYDNTTVAFLASLGTNATFAGGLSSGHVVARSSNGTFSAASDPRSLSGAGLAY